MSEAKECVGGRIVGRPGQLAQPGVQAFPQSALRTLMNPHDARAETHTLCQGRRPPAHGSHCYRPEAAGIMRMSPGRRPATSSHTAHDTAGGRRHVMRTGPRPKAGYDFTH